MQAVSISGSALLSGPIAEPMAARTPAAADGSIVRLIAPKVTVPTMTINKAAPPRNGNDTTTALIPLALKDEM